MFGEGVRRVLLLTAASSFTIAALVGIATLLGGELGDESEQVGYSAALVTAMALIATPGVVLLDQLGPRSSLWTAVGAATALCSLLVLILGLAAIWTDTGDDYEAFGVLVAVALTGSHTSLLTIGRREDDSSGVGMLIFATIAVGTTLGVVVSLAIVGDLDEDGVARMVAALAVLDALGLVLIPIARRLQDDAGARASHGDPAASPRPGSLHQALGLDVAGSQEGRLWMLEAPAFESALRRAEDLGIEPLVAGATEGDGAGRIAVLRDRGGFVVLASRRE